MILQAWLITCLLANPSVLDWLRATTCHSMWNQLHWNQSLATSSLLEEKTCGFMFLIFIQERRLVGYKYLFSRSIVYHLCVITESAIHHALFKLFSLVKFILLPMYDIDSLFLISVLSILGTFISSNKFVWMLPKSA